MQSITLSQLQKNIGLLRKLGQSVQIIDGRRRIPIVQVTPLQVPEKKPSIMRLAGVFSKKAKGSEHMTMNEIREKAWELHVKEKYGTHSGR